MIKAVEITGLPRLIQMFSKVKTGVDCQKQPPLNYTVEVVEKMINYGLSALFYRRQTCKISFTFQCMLIRAVHRRIYSRVFEKLQYYYVKYLGLRKNQVGSHVPLYKIKFTISQGWFTSRRKHQTFKQNRMMNLSFLMFMFLSHQFTRNFLIVLLQKFVLIAM